VYPIVFKLVDVGHSGRSIHGTVVHMGQDSHIAKVGHEGIRLPPQDPFDVHKGETHHMEQDARPDSLQLPATIHNKNIARNAMQKHRPATCVVDACFMSFLYACLQQG